MKFIVDREQLIKPLQQLSHLSCGYPHLPILNNLFLQVSENYLLLTSSNLEIELSARIVLKSDYEFGATTVPARKFFNICRGLPEGVQIQVILKGERMLIFSDRSRYSLSTLPASNFPILDNLESKDDLVLSQALLKRLIESTQFSMAHKDVRYYLNGMLFEIECGLIRTVATDGHRMAICTLSTREIMLSNAIIVPRKGVIELLRILGNTENQVKLQISNSNIRAIVGNYIFTSKLVDGCFPDYRSVLPKNTDKILEASCDVLKKALIRAAVLSNENVHGVRLHLSTNQLKITAKNQEHEEADETLDVIYSGSNMEISFNVNYIIEVLNALKCNEVRLLLTDESSGILIEDTAKHDCTMVATYVIMPMHL